MPHGIKGWASFLAAQSVLTFVWHWIVKLADHAMLTWIDDQIASFFGFAVPQASTVISWVVPAFLGLATLFIYHLVQTRIRKTSSVALDNSASVLNLFPAEAVPVGARTSKQKYFRSDAEALMPVLRQIYEIQFESVRDTTSLIGPLASISGGRYTEFHRSHIQYVLDGLQKINEFYFDLRRDLGQILMKNISFRDELNPYIEYESDSLRENISNIKQLIDSIPTDEWQPKQWPIIIDFIGRVIEEVKRDYKIRGAKVRVLDAKMKDIKESFGSS